MPKSRKRAIVASSKIRARKNRVERKGRPAKPAPKIPAGFEEIAAAVLRPVRPGDAGKED